MPRSSSAAPSPTNDVATGQETIFLQTLGAFTSLPMAEPNSKWPAYARVPPFLPVPLRARRDGWTEDRQVRFIGHLAETGSVAEAAARVGMSRMAAYRLRRCEGARSLAHAWDTVMAQHRGDPPADPIGAKWKVTPAELFEVAIGGPYHVMMRRGRFLRARRKPNNSALLRHLRRLDAAAMRGGWED